MEVYLDNSATTRQNDEVTDLMCRIMKEDYGNPSSLHRKGLAAEKIVKEARNNLASAIGSSSDEVYFTACGTESDNTVLMGTAEARRRSGKRIIVSTVEHPAILEPAGKLESLGYDVVYVGVDDLCRLDMDALKNAVNDETILISVMTVNNETGTVMPLREIGEFKAEYNRAHGTDILLHTDAVQALGKVDCSVQSGLRNVDMMSASAHKLHGPKGVGLLYMKKGLNVRPFMLGGGQEKGFRSGTENVPGVAGFGLAAKMAFSSMDERTAAMAAARAYLLEGLKSELKDIRINSIEDCGIDIEFAADGKYTAKRRPADAAGSGLSLGCPSVLNVSFLGTRGEVILHTLEQDGIYVSTGSACSSNHASSKGSHVLNAMGLKFREIEGAIRFSFSEYNTIEEMDYVIDRTAFAVKKFRKLGSFR